MFVIIIDTLQGLIIYAHDADAHAQLYIMAWYNVDKAVCMLIHTMQLHLVIMRHAIMPLTTCMYFYGNIRAHNRDDYAIKAVHTCTTDLPSFILQE